jgi:hypothetical protein
MKSVRMGSWSSSTPSPTEDQLRRHALARTAVEAMRNEVTGLLGWARDAGFSLEEALRNPAIRQALRGGQQALHELATARSLLAG